MQCLSHIYWECLSFSFLLGNRSEKFAFKAIEMKISFYSLGCGSSWMGNLFFINLFNSVEPLEIITKFLLDMFDCLEHFPDIASTPFPIFHSFSYRLQSDTHSLITQCDNLCSTAFKDFTFCVLSHNRKIALKWGVFFLFH